MSRRGFNGVVGHLEDLQSVLYVTKGVGEGRDLVTRYVEVP